MRRSLFPSRSGESSGLSGRDLAHTLTSCRCRPGKPPLRPRPEKAQFAFGETRATITRRRRRERGDGSESVGRATFTLGFNAPLCAGAQHSPFCCCSWQAARRPARRSSRPRGRSSLPPLPSRPSSPTSPSPSTHPLEFNSVQRFHSTQPLSPRYTHACGRQDTLESRSGRCLGDLPMLAALTPNAGLSPLREKNFRIRVTTVFLSLPAPQRDSMAGQRTPPARE